jgi:hypothetical protein
MRAVIQRIYALVLCDVQMPSGREVGRAIVAEDGAQ